MSLIRLCLPPLAELTLDSPINVAWLDRQGQVSRLGTSSLLELGRDGKKASVECFLHPQDSLLASIELPLLPASKIHAAVQCAAQALILGPVEDVHVAHSLRDAAGRVHIAWLARQALQPLMQMLERAGLKLRGLYPAPYALAPTNGPVAWLEDGHWLLRYDLQHAEVQPVLEEGVDGLGVQRLDPTAPGHPRWTGPVPGWGLHSGWQSQRGEPKGWGRALACAVLAVTVWTLGLNLYAAREASQGQQLKRQMTERVKQAFPELPVILNPLQQARQQLTARQTGSVADPGQRFASLVTQAGSGMPFMAGNLQRLVFADGALQLSLVADGRPSSTDRTWQATLAQAGISAQASDDGWTLRESAASVDTTAGDSQGTDDE